MKNISRALALTGAGILTRAACGTAPETGGDGGNAGSDGGSGGTDYKACMVSDSGGWDDKSFNESSHNGLEAAESELGIQTQTAESTAVSDFEPNINNLVSADCNLVFTVGFLLAPATGNAAQANPDVNFAIVDSTAQDADGNPIELDNVKPIEFNTAEAAFLAGYLAAGMSETGKVATYGGMDIPTVTIFMDGFKQGVEYYNEENGTSVEVFGYQGGDQGSFTGGFAANDTAKQVAAGIIDQGVDVILPVGGPIYQSAIDAIRDSGRDIALIGVDADFFVTDESTQDFVLTSILKQMDVSVYDAIVAAAGGDTNTDAYVGTLENGGVGLAPLHNFEDRVDPALWQAVQDLQDQIISGELTVTSYLEGQG